MTKEPNKPQKEIIGRVACSECGGTGGGKRRPDGRGGTYTDWCLKCGGYGTVPGIVEVGEEA